MIIIKHRWHNLNYEPADDFCDGAEVDIRISNGKLIVQHDPFKSGILFEEWLTKFKKSFLIVNVKEEGLIPFVIEKLKRSTVKEFFILDETIPFIIKHSKEGIRDFGIRVSSWEPVGTALKMMRNLENPPRWVWVDTFNGNLPLRKGDVNELKNSGAKLCLVSPELHPDYFSTTVDDNFLKNVMKVGLKSFDAVCTKIPKFWSKKIEYK